MLIGAIDPGLTGAIAWLLVSDKKGVSLLDVQDIPVATAKQGRVNKSHILLPSVRNLLATPPCYGGLNVTPDCLYIEEVHAMPGQGVTSMFRFGYATGALTGVAAGLDIPTRTIRPQEWQNIVKVRSGPEAGLLKVQQLFPSKAHLFSRKKDHNRADAVLIGYAACCAMNGGTPLLTQ